MRFSIWRRQSQSVYVTQRCSSRRSSLYANANVALRYNTYVYADQYPLAFICFTRKYKRVCGEYFIQLFSNTYYKISESCLNKPLASHRTGKLYIFHIPETITTAAAAAEQCWVRQQQQIEKDHHFVMIALDKRDEVVCWISLFFQMSIRQSIQSYSCSAQRSMATFSCLSFSSYNLCSSYGINLFFVAVGVGAVEYGSGWDPVQHLQETNVKLLSWFQWPKHKGQWLI